MFLKRITLFLISCLFISLIITSMAMDKTEKNNLSITNSKNLLSTFTDITGIQLIIAKYLEDEWDFKKEINDDCDLYSNFNAKQLLAFRPDNKVFIALFSNKIKKYDLKLFTYNWQRTISGDFESACSLSKYKNYLASIPYIYARSMEIHDIVTESYIPYTHTIHTDDSILSLAYDPKGKDIASLHHSGINIWDINTKTCYKTLSNDIFHKAAKVIYSPDGNFLCAFDFSQTYIWDISTEKLVATINDDTMTSIMYSPDGKYIASILNCGKKIKLWNSSNGDLVRAFTDTVIESDSIVSIEFSIDGNYLAAGYNHGIVKIWHIHLDIPPIILNKTSIEDDHIQSLAFSPNGHYLIAGCRNGKIILWKNRAAELLEDTN